MRKTKFVIALGLCLSMVLSSFSAYAAPECTISDLPSTKELNEYLIEAGYPQNIIDDLDEETKLHYFTDKYEFESTNTTYGIFTEDYKIEYSVDELGNINMDDENRAIYNKLIKDKKAVNKILADKIDANAAGADTATSQKAIINSENAELLSLSNWSASMTCSHKSYSNGVARKNIRYSWKWSYNPTWTLTDKVAMAWSGGFTAEPSSIAWTYTRRVTYTGAPKVYTDIPTSGKGYDDYNPGAGCAKAIDIKGPTAGSSNKYHQGSLTADLTKRTSSNTRESAVGRYYHMRILPGISLSFSATGPSISVSSNKGSYDQSSDSAVAFWATSK